VDDTIPTIVADSFTTNEDTQLNENVSANDIDADGDPLTYSPTETFDTPNGTVLMNADGTFTYTPDENFNGTDSFEYTACDNDNNCSTVTVTITVLAVNDAPIAIDDVYSTIENVAVAGNVSSNDSDIDLTPLIYSVLSGPSNGTLTSFASDGSFTYSPNTNYSGSDSFIYEVTDSEGAVDQAVVTINVDSILAVDDEYEVDEDAVLTDDVSTNDTNTSGLVYSVTGGASNGTVTMEDDGTFTYTPNPDFNGTDSFDYQACDALGNCYQATAIIVVNPMEDDEITVSQGFSPNGDNVNETLHIENIDSYPQNKLVIFNRWGNVVYEKSGYSTDSEWNGNADDSGAMGNSKVPEGTYFYVLETGQSRLDASKAPEQLSGFIVIKYANN
jgi:gliding motility-associated-like protein